MKHILVPTDFSETAENAINFAVESAKILPAKITLMYSFEVSDDLYINYAGLNKEYNDNFIREQRQKLTKIKQKITEKEEVEIDINISPNSLNQSVNDLVEEKNIDFVVMGTVGASGLKKLWGSNTSNVIGKTMVPVIAIPTEYQWKKPQKILLATKNFDRTEDILDFLFELSYLYMSNVDVAVFTNEKKDMTKTFLENKENMEEFEAYLREKYHEDTLKGVHLSGGSFEETIEAYIDEYEVDILTMITYQNGFWKSIVQPSMTKRMSFSLKVPLLAIPVNYVRK